MITEKNESKLLTKDISCECKCRFDWKKNVIQINSGITINAYASARNAMYVKRLYLESCYM